MDKTTTWLVRGAAIIIIVVGWVSYLDPYLKKQEQIRINSDFENQSSQARERCNQKERISYSKFLYLVNSGLVKTIQVSPEFNLSEIKTNDGNFVVSIGLNSDLMDLLSKNNVQIIGGSKGLCK